MQLRENAKYGIAVPTSMGVRITPPGSAPAHLSNSYLMHATSAESNVINISSALGIKGLVLTNFVKDSPIAYFIKSEMRRRNIDYCGPDIPQGGPWGYRHQFNIADSGFGVRGPRVHNDRAGEVGLAINIKDFDLEQIFGEDGAKIFHMTGLFAALSLETSRFCLDVAKVAKKHGSLISFDINHRASFWKGRETELRKNFTEIAEMTDILMGNEEDFQLALGIEGPKEGGHELTGKIDSFKDMIGRVKSRFSGATVFCTTLRQVLSAHEHMWGAISLFGDEWNVVEPRPIQILDRIGGGDSFVGGLLYGILTGKTPLEATQLGWAGGAMATTSLEDFASPADEEMLWSIVEGNARVRR